MSTMMAWNLCSPLVIVAVEENLQQLSWQLIWTDGFPVGQGSDGIRCLAYRWYHVQRHVRRSRQELVDNCWVETG